MKPRVDQLSSANAGAHPDARPGQPPRGQLRPGWTVIAMPRWGRRQV